MVTNKNDFENEAVWRNVVHDEVERIKIGGCQQWALMYNFCDFLWSNGKKFYNSFDE